MTHTISGDESFLDRSLLSIGVPPLHIIRAHNSQEYGFFELSGDLDDALHFQHFLIRSMRESAEMPRIRLGPETPAPEISLSGAGSGRIRLHD
jgi:hypothetical protein